MNLRTWVLDLAAATGHRISERQADIYVAEISHWRYSDPEWDELKSKIIRAFDRFPSIPQLIDYAKGVSLGRKGGDRAFRWRESDGVRSVEFLPGQRTRQDPPCSVEVGRRLFADAFIKAGGCLDQLEAMQKALIPDSQIMAMTDSEIPDDMME